MLKTLFTITFFVLTLCAVGSESDDGPQRITIKTSFKWSQDIWGVYEQYKEELIYYEGKKRLTRQIRDEDSNLVIKDGNFILIHPVHNKGIGTINVLPLPYKKLKSSKYKLSVNGNESEIYKAFKSRIDLGAKRFLKKTRESITFKRLKFEDMICVKHKRYIHCYLPVLVHNKKIIPDPFSVSLN